MRREFKLQDPGEGVHEVEITEILVSKGDRVNEGEEVLTVESDKATIELPSPYSGRVAGIQVSEGDIAEVGDVLLVIEDEAESEEAEEEGEPEKAEKREAAEEKEEQKGAPERRPDESAGRGRRKRRPHQSLPRSAEAREGTKT